MKRKPSALAIGLIGLIGLAACDRPGVEQLALSARDGIGQTNLATEDDEVITGLVKAALAASPDINDDDISVTTEQGQVTLSGTVPARQIARAEEVVRNVEGVRVVKNRLKPAGVFT